MKLSSPKYPSMLHAALFGAKAFYHFTAIEDTYLSPNVSLSPFFPFSEEFLKMDLGSLPPVADQSLAQSNIHIISVTYNGQDYTSLTRTKYNTALAAGNTGQNWGFYPNEAFFGAAANANTYFYCILVYRILVSVPSSSGTQLQWSAPITKVAAKNSLLAVETQYSASANPSRIPPAATTNTGRFIVAAFWHNVDVTAAAQGQLVASKAALSAAASITVSPDAFGADPAAGVVKQFTAVYAKNISNQWYYGTVTTAQAPVSYTISIPPAIIGLAEQRLNIYSATYGSRDYTDWIRKKYIHDVYTNPPTDSSNVWTFTPSNTFFGEDPNPNVHKFFTITYRIGGTLSYSTGQLVDPGTALVTNQAWWSQNNTATIVGDYPTFGAATNFRGATIQEDTALTLDLSTLETTSFVAPAANNNAPAAFKAYWGTADVTSSVATSLSGAISLGGDLTITVAAGPLNKGVDPNPNIVKQMVIVLGYRRSDDTSIWDIRTVIAIQDGTYNLPIHRTLIDLAVQGPTPYAPLKVNKINWENRSATTAWPQIYHKSGQLFFDGQTEPVPNSYQLGLSMCAVLGGFRC